MVDEDRYRDRYLDHLEASEPLVRSGCDHDEVSSFALPGHVARHNRVFYWSGAPWLGPGDGAHGCRHPLRRWNLRDWAAYQEMAVSRALPVNGEERLGPGTRHLEPIWLGFRSRAGIARTELSGAAMEVVSGRVRRGWALADPDAVRPTPRGWLLLDRLASDLDDVVPPAKERPPARAGESSSRFRLTLSSAVFDLSPDPVHTLPERP